MEFFQNFPLERLGWNIISENDCLLKTIPLHAQCFPFESAHETDVVALETD